MSKLTNIELNVLAVALDHMEEHLNDISLDFGKFHKSGVQEKLSALETLKTKLL